MSRSMQNLRLFPLLEKGPKDVQWSTGVEHHLRMVGDHMGDANLMGLSAGRIFPNFGGVESSFLH